MSFSVLCIESEASMIEKLFACCLSAGFLFSFFFFFTGAKIRILHGRKFRIPGFRMKKSAHPTAMTMPWGLPIFVGMFLTLFGFSGLALKILLHLPAIASAAIGFSIAAIGGGLGVRLFHRYFAITANEVKGNPLPGMIGHVSLSIPQNGVGSIAFRSDGKRVVMPARDRSGNALSKGSRVIVVDIRDRVALVEEL
jgi:hypothetical protein